MAEEKRMTMEEIRLALEGKAKEFNEARLEKDYTKMESTMIAIQKLEDDYAHEAKLKCFKDLAATDNPMHAACLKMNYTVLKSKDVTEEEVTSLIIEEKPRAIDLLSLNEYCGGIGAEENWKHQAQYLNMLFTARTAKELKLNPKEVSDSFAMTEIARKIDAGGTPLSNTQMTKALDNLIKAMLGEGYKALSSDLVYLDKAQTRKGRKALTLQCTNNKKFVGLMLEVCHRVLTNGFYGLDYKKRKDAVETPAAETPAAETPANEVSTTEATETK